MTVHELTRKSGLATPLLAIATAGYAVAAVLPWQQRVTESSGGWESGAVVPRLAVMITAVAVGLVAMPGGPLNDRKRSAVLVPIGLMWWAGPIALVMMGASLDRAVMVAVLAAGATLLGGALAWEPHSAERLPVHTEDRAPDADASVDW